MEISEIKQKIIDLIEIDKIIKSYENKKETLRKEISEWMILNESDLLTIPNQCKVFLQSKTTFKNYPQEIVDLQTILESKKKEAELNNNVDKNVTHFIKLELIKPKELYVNE